MIAVAWDGTDVRTALVRVDGRLVVCIDDSGSAKGAEGLSEHIDREFAPGKLAKDAVGEGNGRVEVATGFTTAVDT